MNFYLKQWGSFIYFKLKLLYAPLLYAPPPSLDITDNRNRTKLSKLLEKFRLERVQYSAFRGGLDINGQRSSYKKGGKFVRDENDRIFIIPLCKRCSESLVVVSSMGIDFVVKDKVKFL